MLNDIKSVYYSKKHILNIIYISIYTEYRIIIAKKKLCDYETAELFLKLFSILKDRSSRILKS